MNALIGNIIDLLVDKVVWPIIIVVILLLAWIGITIYKILDACGLMKGKTS